MIGQTISHYKILAKIGEGGMGVVYKAEDTRLDRMVALKFLPEHALNEPAAKARFIHEAKGASAINHPNITTVYDIGDADGQSFIAMEYLEGKTLKEAARENLKLNRALEIAIQAAEGLSAAHKKEIVHRDIKSENIMATKEDVVKIMDFGLAKLKGAGKLTESGTTLGTIAYMSPEQTRGERIDHRSDIFSLGVVLYELITGRLPFQGDHNAAIIYSICYEKPDPLARYKAGVSENLQRILDKALEKNPQARYQTVDDLLADLKRERHNSWEPIRPVGRSKIFSKAVLWPAAIALFAVLAVFILLPNILKQLKKALPPKYTQLTFSGDVEEATLSPDGQFIAYFARKGDAFNIMVQDIGGGKPLEIFSGIMIPLKLGWGPEENMVTFTGYLKDLPPSAFIVPRLGGKARRYSGVGNFSWSPDGSQFAVTGLFTPRRSIGFMSRSTGVIEDTIPLGGNFRRLLEVDWSPSGNRLLFLTTDERKYKIWTIRTDGKLQQEIVNDSVRLSAPHWSADGKAIYYLRPRGQTRDLMKVKVSPKDGKPNGKPVVLQSGLETWDMTLSENNRKMAYTKSLSYSNLWLATLNNKGEAGSVRTQKLTGGTATYARPEISPDGKKIAFSFKGNIHLMQMEGGEMEQLTFLESPAIFPCWSRDGESIAFVSNDKVWQISSKGGTPRSFEKTEVGWYEGPLTWGPGEDILYQIENIRYRLLNPRTEEERPLVQNDSDGFMSYARYSPDGQYVAVAWNKFIPENQGGIWLISLKDGSQTFLARGNDFDPIGWSADGQWIFVVNELEKPAKLWRVPVRGGKPEIFATLPFENVRHIAMTPDGKQMICSVPETYLEAWLLENFDPEVK